MVSDTRTCTHPVLSKVNYPADWGYICTSPDHPECHERFRLVAAHSDRPMVAPQGMEVHVITFSTLGLKNGWVEVAAKNEAIVRAWADKEYRRWSTTYPMSDFPPDVQALYPLGCIGRTTLHFEEADHV